MRDGACSDETGRFAVSRAARDARNARSPDVEWHVGHANASARNEHAILHQHRGPDGSRKFPYDLSSYIYFGYPGEPALGPPTFMHRLSAMDNPDAPIGHHWEDSTHITFAVATAGIAWKNVKVEGSIFTGREPDENRYDFYRPRFDSFSGRSAWYATQNLSIQV